MELASLFWCFLLLVPTSAVSDTVRNTVRRQPKHYLSFDVLGDLTNAWECIMNAGIVAGEMKGMTLVVPDFGQLRHGENAFSQIYDMDHFKAHMQNIGVDVVEAVPAGIQEASLATQAGVNLNELAKSWKEELDEKHANQDTHFRIQGNIGFDTLLSRQLKACEQQYGLCDDVAGSLQFTPRLQALSQGIVDKLQEGGDWLALHLHDFTPFLCDHSIAGELKRVKERIEENKLKPTQLYVVGGTEDLTMVSSALGIHSGPLTQAPGRVAPASLTDTSPLLRRGSARMTPTNATRTDAIVGLALDALSDLLGMAVKNKHTFLGTEADRLHFQEAAAVDFGVALQASAYMTKPGSSFDEYWQTSVSSAASESAPIAYRARIAMDHDEGEASSRAAAAAMCPGCCESHLVDLQTRVFT